MTPLIIGHRGFASRFPDNSLAGIRAAIAAGADGVEVDVRPCADGDWVCHHDLRRLGREIGSWRLGPLRRAGAPALAEVVDAMPAGRWLFVEVKPVAAAELTRRLPGLVDLLGPRAATTRVISSSLAVLGAVEEALPEAPQSLVFGELPEWLPLDVDLSPKHTLVEALADSGRALHPWTVNRAPRMRELARLGVASITTNCPDVALEVVRG
jgi:glycerophosphoryl diester phosphodiesterase